jgi:hypothetical protein
MDLYDVEDYLTVIWMDLPDVEDFFKYQPKAFVGFMYLPGFVFIVF